MNRRLREDGGAVAVMTAIMAVVLLSLAALVVDLGLARDSRRQAQNTADAAALAAANALYATSDPDRLNQPGDFDGAVVAAKEYAASNYGVTDGEWASCTTDDPLGYVHSTSRTNCISFDDDLYPREVLVVVPVRNTPVFFGGVVGYEGTTISALAQARLDPGGRRLCTFCVLGSGPHDLQNGNLEVTGGNVWFNGDVEVNPEGGVNSTKDFVVGDDGSTFEDGGNTYVEGGIGANGNKVQGGNAQVGQPRIVDPLAAEVLPFAMQSSLAGGTDPCTQGPGIYGDLTVKGTCEFPEPGLYVFTGKVDLGGGGTLITNGATLYFTCGSGSSAEPCDSPGEEGGFIEATGNPTYQFNAPQKATHPGLDELWGYALVFDRYNTATTWLRGTADSYISGTVYGPSMTLDIGGTADNTTPFSSWFVIGRLLMNGSATITVDFDSSKNRRPSEGARGLVR
jgi:Flp pilus assembly protein TadG